MTYWHYTYIIGNNDGERSYGWGIRSCHATDFDFVRTHIDYPKMVILSVTQITKEQFDALTEVAEETNKKKEK